MFILDISSKGPLGNIRKTILVYLILGLCAIGVDKIYAFFGHGVHSPAMTWMFLYPLIGGSLVYLTIRVLFPNINYFIGYRAFFNVYNSGIATLTAGSFLKGILDIAGTSSSYTVLFFIAGWLLVALGLVLLTILVVHRKKIVFS